MATLSHNIRDFFAKIAIVAWIGGLISVAFWTAHRALVTDGNTLLGLSGADDLSKSIALEVRLTIGMAAVAIAGGTCFIIKDFYKSIKNANRYALAFGDWRLGNLSRDSFQKLVPLDVYIGRFNHTWLFWFLVQPVLSTLLGVIAFFIARSGLGVLQGASTSSSTLTAQSVYMYAVFTFLAGFSSHKFIAWLDRLADKIFSSTLPEKKEAVRADVNAAAADDRATLRSEIESGQDDDHDGQDDHQIAPTAVTAVTKKIAPVVSKNSVTKNISVPSVATRPEEGVDRASAEIAHLAGTEGVKKVM